MQRGSVAAVYRTIPYEILGFKQLGLPTVVSQVCEKPRGLVLVTGPTGSGKTTTLAAMLVRKFRVRKLPDPEEHELLLARASGIWAMRAIPASISRTPTVRRFLAPGRKRTAAPASSITSMALSGRKRSARCLVARSTAVRKAAKERFSWDEMNAFLAQRQVKLLSAGLDEVPMVYKDIDEVMAAQADLVEPVAKFQPKIVKMAPAGERPED